MLGLFHAFVCQDHNLVTVINSLFEVQCLRYNNFTGAKLK